MSDEKITTKEAADRLGISVGRIRQMVIAGDLPAEKFGRDLMIRVDDLAKVKVYGKPGRPVKQDEGDDEASSPAPAKKKRPSKKTSKKTSKKG